MYTFPDELLSSIFELCLAPPTTQQVSNRPSVEIVISHVCKRWRAVALDDSRLWASIRVSHNCDSDKVNSYLSRSKNSLLDATVNLSAGDPQDLLERLDIHRWRTATIIIPRQDLSPFAFFQLPHDYTPILDVLHIRSEHHQPSFSKIPQIHVSLSNFPLFGPNLTTLIFFLPYWQAKLDLDDLVNTVFSSASSITHLTLRGCVIERSAPPLSFPPPPHRAQPCSKNSLHAPNLRHLSLGATSSKQEFHLLDLLDAPHLEFLELMDFDSNEWSIFRNVLSCPFQRKAVATTTPGQRAETPKMNTLKTLQLVETDVDGIGKWLLEATPSLQNFVLVNSEVEMVGVDVISELNDVIAQMDESTRREGVWPSLQTIALSHCEHQAIGKFFRGRVGGGKGLRVCTNATVNAGVVDAKLVDVGGDVEAR